MILMNNKFNNKTYNNNLNISPISIFLFIFVIAFLGFGLLSTYLGIKNNEIDFTIFGLLFASIGIIIGINIFTNIKFNFLGILFIEFGITALYFLSKNNQIFLKILIGYPITISIFLIGILSFFPKINIQQDKIIKLQNKINKYSESYYKIDKVAKKIYQPIQDIIILIVGIFFTIIGILFLINIEHKEQLIIILPFSLVFIYLGIGIIYNFIKIYFKKRH